MSKRRARNDRPEAPIQAGSSDARQSMELLWGSQKGPSRGPRPGLTVATITGTAIRLADQEGLAALSMRRVAEELGVGAMSLYTYVPGKAELLEVMFDSVLGEDAWSFSVGSSWRARLELLARRSFALFLRHPWMLQIPWARAPLGPNSVSGYERAMSAVAGIGLSAREMANTVSLISTFVRGAAQTAAEAEHAEKHSGQTDDQWWQARAPLLEKMMDPKRFPTLASAASEGAFTPSRSDVNYNLAEALDAFEFGLPRLLDGLETYLNRPKKPPGRPRDKRTR